MLRSTLIAIAVVTMLFTLALAQTSNFDHKHSVKLDCTASGMHSTGDTVWAGDSVLVFARGVYRQALGSENTGNWIGPGGNGRAPAGDMPCQDAAGGSLIGQIDDGARFPIGTMRSFIADSYGVLKVGINENAYWDNDGYLVVTIIISGRNVAYVPDNGGQEWDVEGALLIRPNPTLTGAEMVFKLVEASDVSLVVYDVSGRLVADLARGLRAAGEHSVRWDGRNSEGTRVAPGAYYAVLSTGNRSSARRVIHIE